MNRPLNAFSAHLAQEKLREIDLALAVLWFIGHQDSHARDVDIVEIVHFMEQNRLKSGVNSSRLSQNLRANSGVVKGRTPNTFRMKAGADAAFLSAYGTFLEPSLTYVSDTVIINGLALGGRRHLERVRTEANGAFEVGLYNSCAVMCRRLTELLLLEAFVSSGHSTAIQDARGEFVTFGDMIEKAKSGQHIKLSRTSPRALDRLKQVGDAAAHHRYYLTTKQDIDSLNPGLAHLLAELAAVAGY